MTSLCPNQFHSCWVPFCALVLFILRALCDPHPISSSANLISHKIQTKLFWYIHHVYNQILHLTHAALPATTSHPVSLCAAQSVLVGGVIAGDALVLDGSLMLCR